jgi:hypothetical protein
MIAARRCRRKVKMAADHSNRWRKNCAAARSTLLNGAPSICEITREPKVIIIRGDLPHGKFIR